MFDKPRPLAHLSFALVMFGLVVQSVAKYAFDDSGALVGLAFAFYFAAFPFSILALMCNWRVERKMRLDLWSSVEVGVGMLPFLLTVLLVAYALWFAGR